MGHVCSVCNKQAETYPLLGRNYLPGPFTDLLEVISCETVLVLALLQHLEVEVQFMG